MPATEGSIRPATLDDAPALAELVNMAGEGLPLYLWGRMAAAGEDPWEIGRGRARRESGGFSYRNAVVLSTTAAWSDASSATVSPTSPSPSTTRRRRRCSCRSSELENLAPGTWYVNVLATYPEQRGKGIGTRLLAVAETLASGAKGLSIIVSDGNVGARRLYERCGYREVATRPMVKEGWENEGENWVLLMKGI